LDPREIGWINTLLVSIPIASILAWTHTSVTAQFIFSSLAIIPLAGILGDATEVISDRAGPSIGGLMNATFGNATEMIVAIFAVFNHLDDIVKASFTGSIISNALLVLGTSILAGGFKFRVQHFNKMVAGTCSTMAVMAAIGLIVPAFIHNFHLSSQEGKLSVGVSVILILSYVCLLIFSLKTHANVFNLEASDAPATVENCSAPLVSVEAPPAPPLRVSSKKKLQQRLSFFLPAGIAADPEDPSGAAPPENDAATPEWSMRKAIVVLFVATGLIAWMSEILTATVEDAGRALGLSNLFLGVVVLGIVGNAAEHVSAIMMAAKNRMTIAVNIAMGSVLQIALFVAPFMVLLSYARDVPMDLIFTPLEVFAIFLALVVVWMVLQDGESTWIEGMMLAMLYCILAVGFAYVDDPDAP